MDTKNALIEALADLVAPRLQAGYKHDLPAGFTLTTNFMHGPSGIFGTAGADRDVFSSRVVPRGLLQYLPAVPSVDTNPITYYLTGFTAQTGSEPYAPCAECVKAGNIKACRQGTVFGKICRETDELDISAVGRHVNRGEYYDLRLVNDPILMNSDWIPTSIPRAAGDVLNREVLARWLTLGAAFEQVLSRMVFTGSTLNNVGTGYAEFLGLEQQVGTGHTDVIDQTSCPSLDSDIKDARGASVETDAAGIFALMSMLYRYVKHNAETMNFSPVVWNWVIKDSLFRVLCDYWPCVYASFACTSPWTNAQGAGVVNGTDAMTMRRMSDDLYNGRYLTIDGERIPVIIDDAIPYRSSAQGFNLPAGTFDSSIYLLPMTIRGGQQVTFMEYFDYAATNSVMQAIQDGRFTNEFWTDGGRFLWTFSRTKWCVNWSAKVEPRLRLLTPQLAGRILNVRWTPLQMFREPFNDQGYFANGGITTGHNAPYTITR